MGVRYGVYGENDGSRLRVQHLPTETEKDQNQTKPEIKTKEYGSVILECKLKMMEAREYLETSGGDYLDNWD